MCERFGTCGTIFNANIIRSLRRLTKFSESLRAAPTPQNLPSDYYKIVRKNDCINFRIFI